jgi:hypothetical protein
MGPGPGLLLHSLEDGLDSAGPRRGGELGGRLLARLRQASLRREGVPGPRTSGILQGCWPAPPAASGVDSKWEMRLYGLVRTGDKAKAVRFLQDTRSMPRNEASQRVAQVAADWGSVSRCGNEAGRALARQGRAA